MRVDGFRATPIFVFVFVFEFEFEFEFVFVGIWASAGGVLPKVHAPTGHLPRPQRLGQKYKVGSSQNQKPFLLDETLIAFVQGADCGWPT